MLIARAPATAAERDRLKVVNEGLVKLIQVILDVADDTTVLDAWRKEARAVLAEVGKP